MARTDIDGVIADSKNRVVVDPGHGGGEPGVVHAGTGLREDDRTVALKERTGLANARDACLVSIHCNGANDPRVGGAEVWCFARLDADGRESAGYRIARLIHREIVALGLRNRGVKPIYDRRREQFVGQKLWILRKSRRPAVAIFRGLRGALLDGGDGDAPGKPVRA